MKVLIVDDEALARSRLAILLADCADVPTQVVGEAANADEALACLRRTAADLVLLDIHMPGLGGIGLAQALRRLPNPPMVVFVTAHPQHALAAFEIEAVDYLTKPVRLERLAQALRKAELQNKLRRAETAGFSSETLLIRERGRTERVPIAEVLYLRAEMKYVTVRTRERSHLLEGSLGELEARHADRFIRVHRSTLVARQAVRALERQDAGDDAESWAVRLSGIDELLSVSRRQLAAVREVIAGK